MDKIILVDVTQKDIDEGIQASTQYCPIALAVKREFPTSDIVTVNGLEASVYIPPKTTFKFFTTSKAKIIRLQLPFKAYKFIANFDAYGPKDIHVKPFKFEIAAVEMKQ